jgi:hypothetical protein
MEPSNTKCKVRACSTCGRTAMVADLVVKRADFRKPGVGGQVLRVRVLGYLCPECLDCDDAYCLPRLAAFTARSASPVAVPR